MSWVVNESPPAHAAVPKLELFGESPGSSELVFIPGLGDFQDVHWPAGSRWLSMRICGGLTSWILFPSGIEVAIHSLERPFGPMLTQGPSLGSSRLFSATASIFPRESRDKPLAGYGRPAIKRSVAACYRPRDWVFWWLLLLMWEGVLGLSCDAIRIYTASRGMIEPGFRPSRQAADHRWPKFCVLLPSILGGPADYFTVWSGTKKRTKKLVRA